MDQQAGQTRGALPDLTLCDREPIHTIGHIQPHGVLVATEPGGLRISHVSQNVEQALGLKPEALLGAALAELAGAQALAAMEQSLRDTPYMPANLLRLTLPIPLRPQRQVLVHRHHGRMIVELEDQPRNDTSGAALLQAQTIIASLRQTRNAAELCGQTVRALRQLTGFDRVMVYRFDQDGHGSVIAEDKAAGLEPYLHLHYPASDIPQQARRLYLSQRVRAIPDAAYRPVALVSADGAELDMSLCALRGISPVHLEYLRNMGVAGSFSISLLRGNALWGMIIGHHRVARHSSATLRGVFDIIGQLVALLLQRDEASETLAGQLERTRIIHQLRHGIDAAASLADALQAQAGAVLGLMQAGGALIRCGGQTRRLGDTPPAAAAVAMAETLLRASGGEISALAEAGRPGGIAAAYPSLAAGILAMNLPGDPSGIIAWFRPERAATVLWAGNPDKAALAQAGQTRVSPRQSFAAWREAQRGCSARWTKGDLLAAEQLQRELAQALLIRAAAEAESLPAGQLTAIEKSQIVIEYALDGTILRANPNALAALGFELAELAGRHHRLLVDQGEWDSPEYWAFWNRLGKGEYQAGEYKRIRKDGGEVWLQATYNPVFGADGKPYKIVKLATEITQQKLAAAEIAGHAAAIARSQAVIEFDMNGHVLTANANYLAILGFTLAEVVGRHHRSFADPAEPDNEAGAQFWARLRVGHFETAEFMRRGKDGREVWLQATYNPVLDRRGLPYKVVKIATDITARKLAETQIVTLRAEFMALIDAPPDAKLRLFESVVIQTTDGVLITEAEPRDLPGPRIVYANPAFTTLTGYSPEEVIGKTPRILQGPLTERAALDKIRDALLAWQPVLVELQNYRKDGTSFWMELSISPVRDDKGWFTHWISVQRDVTERRRLTEQLRDAAERLQHGAHHDTLTGLPNRRLFVDRIEQAIALAARHGKKLAVLFIDLDGFKHINDSLGHATGDKLLKSVSLRLVECVRGSDTVSRQGGDEFVVLLADLAAPADAAITARRFLQAVAETHAIDGHELHVTASIGISVYPDNGADAAALIKAADTAMYKVKAGGRHGYQFFEDAMKAGAAERQRIEESLRRAIKNGEFALHYQPKVNLRTGAITGAEALLRWTHPELGAISPAAFIPVAEDCGLIRTLGAWVLREACEQGRRWSEAGLPPLTMAVNVSPIELGKGDFLADVRGILRDTGFDPSQLELELTEGVLMKNPALTRETLKALKAEGMRLAIDDFGTGYSSLSYLTRFPIDTLKIDQSFIRQLGTDAAETAIVTAIIGMARSLKLGVVAEGVETREELEFLARMGCDEAQGYFFSHPVAAAAFTPLLEAVA